jgi:multidrug efflux pump subunit AcrA (membrane-fusion protein)
MTRHTKTFGVERSAFGCGLWALGMVALSAACASAPQSERVPTPVRTEKVKPASIERGVRYSAQIVPDDQVAVF